MCVTSAIPFSTGGCTLFLPRVVHVQVFVILYVLACPQAVWGEEGKQPGIHSLHMHQSVPKSWYTVNCSVNYSVFYYVIKLNVHSIIA